MGILYTPVGRSRFDTVQRCNLDRWGGRHLFSRMFPLCRLYNCWSLEPSVATPRDSHDTAIEPLRSDICLLDSACTLHLCPYLYIFQAYMFGRNFDQFYFENNHVDNHYNQIFRCCCRILLRIAHTQQPWLLWHICPGCSLYILLRNCFLSCISRVRSPYSRWRCHWSTYRLHKVLRMIDWSLSLSLQTVVEQKTRISSTCIRLLVYLNTNV